MNAVEIAEKLDFKLLTRPARECKIESVYCGDLLSLVMSRAKADCAWITVMCNVNVIGVASLVDVGCVVLSEGMLFDDDTLKKAEEEGICVLATELDTFSAAKAIDSIL